MNLFKPMNPPQASSHLDHYFTAIQAKHPDKPLQVRIVSGVLGLDFTYPPGSSSQPYHIASIGKVFTASLIYMLAEKGTPLPAGFNFRVFHNGRIGPSFCLQEPGLRPAGNH